MVGYTTYPHPVVLGDVWLVQFLSLFVTSLLSCSHEIGQCRVCGEASCRYSSVKCIPIGSVVLYDVNSVAVWNVEKQLLLAELLGLDVSRVSFGEVTMASLARLPWSTPDLAGTLNRAKYCFMFRCSY